MPVRAASDACAVGARTVVVISLWLLAAVSTASAETAIRGLALPSSISIEAEGARPFVDANVRGDVVATAHERTGSQRDRIVVWDASGRRTLLPIPTAIGNDTSESPAKMTDGIVTPSGRVYGTVEYFFEGGYSGWTVHLFTWSQERMRILQTKDRCGHATADLHPGGVLPDGRIVLNDGYDSAIMSGDSLAAGSFPPTAHAFDGHACTSTFDPGWIDAVDGASAGGYRGYWQGSLSPPRANAAAQRYVAVRWTGLRATEIGHGAVLGINARGDCVGSDVPPQTSDYGYLVHGDHDSTRIAENAVVMHARLWRRDGTGMSLSHSANRSIAYGINESGRTIVGTAFYGKRQYAVRWRDGREERLESFLPRNTGWRLDVAYGVTPDGSIYGVGRRGRATWVFVMTVSPERS